MKYLISYFAIVTIAICATGDIQLKQKTASGAFRDITIPVTNSTLLGFGSDGSIGKVTDIPTLNIGELNITGNVLPLPPGSIIDWATADIANRPTNTLVCDGNNGTTSITAPTGATAIVVANTTLAAPSVTPASGTYTVAQTVTATADAGATIYYTSNATDPTRASSVYSAPITASTSAEYRFAQAKSPGLLSPITSRTYTINTSTDFTWGAESLTAVATGDTSGVLTGATLSAAQAHAGTQSLYCSGAAWQYIEYSTGATANADYDWTIGTATFYVRWTGTWTANPTLISLNANSGSGRIIALTTSTQGQVQCSYRGSNNSSTTVNVTGLTNPDTWYLVTLKWRTASSPYLSAQIDAGTPVTNTVGLASITEATSKIAVGNFSAVAGTTFYIDDVTITKTW